MVDAKYVLGELRDAMGTRFHCNYPIQIMHGCSEYPLKFPDFGKVNCDGEQNMSYDESWKDIETSFDIKSHSRKSGGTETERN